MSLFATLNSGFDCCRYSSEPEIRALPPSPQRMQARWWELTNYPFHCVPCDADIYLQMDEKLHLANGPSTMHILVHGFWALGVSWLQDRKTTWASTHVRVLGFQHSVVWEQWPKQGLWCGKGIGIHEKNQIHICRGPRWGEKGWERKRITTTPLSSGGRRQQ